MRECGVSRVADVTTARSGTPDMAGLEGGSPDGVLLGELHDLLAGARRQQTVLRESLATVIGFLERSPD